MAELREGGNWNQSVGLSAWLLSLVLHGSAATAIGLGVQANAPTDAPEPAREGSIVLVARSLGHSEYFSDEAVRENAVHTDQPTPLPAATPPPAVSGLDLPSAQDLGAVAAASDVPIASAVANSGGSKAGPATRGHARATETQVFGVRGTGSRFVYVFDRSSSMEGGPLAAAKRELVASLQNLQSVHQFQIIFYNQEPQLMPAFRGQSPQMVFGDDSGKRLAAQFIGGILAQGATDHLRALQTALRMRPDVIFFLTDAEEPKLRASDFDKVRQLNQGTTINAIEFGVGPAKAPLNFLQQLAAENGGQHTYVDVTRLAR